MTTAIIITLSILVLFAYVFDITASKTKIPSVILLLVLGFSAKLITESFSISVPNLNPILPILGTIGLILIVLEGSLELEINKSKLILIFKSSIVAFLPLLIMSLGLAYYLNYSENTPFKLALGNAIPLGIISSAIAIPSARNLLRTQKEFITYESSLSDIFGVIFFNFITLNDNIGSETFGHFLVELLTMLAISFVSTLLLAGFLNKTEHHVKFIPIIISVILIYSISKLFHLPALMFILLFGLFIGNMNDLRSNKLFKIFHISNFSNEVYKFKEITSELAFLTRALFFLLFGFLINPVDAINTEKILLSICITLAIFLVRFLILKFFKVPFNPLVFIAPRGLITILLFLSIPTDQQIQQIDKSLIIQVIIFSNLIMMLGLLGLKKSKIDII